MKTLFESDVPRIGALIVGVNRVQVGGFHHFNVHACVFCGLNRGVQQATCFAFAPLFGYGTDGITPFLCGDGVGVGLCGPPSKPHGVSPVVRGLW